MTKISEVKKSHDNRETHGIQILKFSDSDFKITGIEMVAEIVIYMEDIYI